MIIESSILIELRKIEEKMNNGEEIYAFYTESREEAECLKSVIDNQNTIYIVVDQKVSDSIEVEKSNNTKAGKARKASNRKKA